MSAAESTETSPPTVSSQASGCHGTLRTSKASAGGTQGTPGSEPAVEGLSNPRSLLRRQGDVNKNQDPTELSFLLLVCLVPGSG